MPSGMGASLLEVVKLKQSKTGSLAVCLFLYIPVVWAALLIAQSLGGGLPDIVEKLTAALENPFSVHWTEYSGLSILFCTAAYILALLYRSANQGRTRDGEEHGSATWASPREVNAQFSQKENKLLTRNVRLGLDTHKHRRSLNVLVIGGSGAGKSRSYVKPNILEANTNYVVTDPKSEVLLATGGWLEQNGYDIRVLNLVNLEESDGYNPFRYIRDEKDALRLVNNLIQAKGKSGSYSTNFQQSGRELLTPDEVRMLDNRYAILFIRGAKPVMDLKYELTQHPAICHTVDGGGPPYIHHQKKPKNWLPGKPLFDLGAATFEHEKENPDYEESQDPQAFPDQRADKT